MAVFKCKMCGGDMTVDRVTGIVICDYCGTKQTLPQFTDDSSNVLYNLGNSYLMQNEFDKAENLFNQLLSTNPQDAEVYWDLVMCKYGVSFVKDAKTGKYIPTCNHTHYQSILQDKNYEKAIYYSTGDKKAFYEESARTIDEIQRGIIAVSKKEKPYDIFISYKETNPDGGRSQDSIEAQKLYDRLTNEGYKVFFSRITLEGKAGTEYEPYIFAALSSSKVMITICSSKENIESAWVKNEWSRFLTLRQNNPSKVLIPVYYDMPKSELPDEFSVISSYDMKQEGFEQELIRGIKKLIPLPIMLKEKRAKRRKTLGIISLVLLGVIAIAAVISIPKIKMYMENNKAYEQVMQLYYDGNYPEAAWGFRDMKGFKDSAEMQKQSELKWRESLANVVTTSAGEYYVTANGSVDCFAQNHGSENNGIEINEHGKIVSITNSNKSQYRNNGLYALYEDGYVYNSAKNNGVSEDYTDIIQITNAFNSTNVVLKNDGTVNYGKLGGNAKNSFNGATDKWIESTKEWKNIVSLSYCTSNQRYAISDAVLLGVDTEGNVFHTYYSVDYDYKIPDGVENKQFEKDLKYVEGLKNIKLISAFINDGFINIAAVDKSNTVFTHINGKTKKYEFEKNIRNIEVMYWEDYLDMDNYKLNEETTGSNVFIIDENFNLININTEKTISKDVVWLNRDEIWPYNQGFYVTMSGNIYKRYCIANSNPEKVEGKSPVYDMWKEDKKQ